MRADVYRHIGDLLTPGPSVPSACVRITAALEALERLRATDGRLLPMTTHAQPVRTAPDGPV